MDKVLRQTSLAEGANGNLRVLAVYPRRRRRRRRNTTSSKRPQMRKQGKPVNSPSEIFPKTIKLNLNRERCQKGRQIKPKWSERVPNERQMEQKGAKSAPNGAKGYQKGAKWSQKGAKREAKGDQNASQNRCSVKVAKRLRKGSYAH